MSDDGVFDFHPKCKYCEQDANGFHEKSCPVSEGNRLYSLGQELSEENARLKEFLQEIYNEEVSAGHMCYDTLLKLLREVSKDDENDDHYPIG